MRIALLCLCCCAQIAQADTDQNPVDTLALRALNTRLNVFLDTIDTITGARIEATEALRTQTVNGWYEGSVEDVLEKLGRSSDLDWFQFNNTYYVGLKSEAATRIVQLGDIGYDGAVTALENANITADFLNMISVADGSAIVLTGHPKLVAFSEAILQSIQPPDETAADAPQIRVRRANRLSVESLGQVILSQASTEPVNPGGTQSDVPPQ